MRTAATLAAVLAAGAASAQTLSLNHSGYLLGANDQPIDGARAFRFSIVDAASSACWQSDPAGTSPCSLTVRAGYYTVALGSECGAAIPTSCANATAPRYLNVNVAGIDLEPPQLLQPASIAVQSRDTQALAASLAQAGSVNATTNPVDWTRLKGVPTDLVDGDDVGLSSLTAGAGLLGAGTSGDPVRAKYAGTSGDYGASDDLARADHRHDARYLQSISAGAGLTGNGASTPLAVSFAAPVGDAGSATNAARSDHLHDARYVKLDGSGALTGALTLANSTPTNALHAASKGYVDQAIASLGLAATTSPGSFNFAYEYETVTSGAGDLCTTSTTWANVPSVGQVTLTTSGGPVLLVARRTQYKAGAAGCSVKGYLSARVTPQGQAAYVLEDVNGFGQATSFECHGVGSFATAIPVPAGTHTFRLVEKGESTNTNLCSSGRGDMLLAIELGVGAFANYQWQRAPALAQQTTSSTAWAAVPTLSSRTITTTGGPLLVMGSMRTYKSVNCDSRGFVTAQLTTGGVTTTLDDVSLAGQAAGYQCNSVANFTTVVARPAGTHTVNLAWRAEAASPVYSFGATDSLVVVELPQAGLNYQWVRASNTSATALTVTSQTWADAPTLNPLQLTTRGGPVWVAVSKRQYKTVTCARGLAALRVTPFGGSAWFAREPTSDGGLGQTFHCNATNNFNALLPLGSGMYGLQVVERVDIANNGVNSYGNTDSFLAMELR